MLISPDVYSSAKESEVRAQNLIHSNTQTNTEIRAVINRQLSHLGLRPKNTSGVPMNFMFEQEQKV